MFDDYECKPISEMTIWETWKYNRLNARRWPKIYCEDVCPGSDKCEWTRYCMCGSEMEAHSIVSDHSPVSMHDYYGKLGPWYRDLWNEIKDLW